ncbi:MAG: pyridoxamine 5'-phosphate oxidase family protein [Desulfuromonadales bacterium]|jgi:nitroimidazol reductase NimA-like FMN-containing flavoprotein (pyridoxamine 5'-phosphate oxidase superfamily)
MMRRHDKAIDRQEAETLLQNGEYGVLSTVDAQGQPYGVPLNYVFLEGAVFFHCALEGHKLQNIAQNNRVSFCVVGRTRVLPEQFNTQFESVILSGRASLCQGQERLRALVALVEKYAPDHIEAGHAYIEKHDRKTAVVKITIDTLTAKAKRGQKNGG